MPLSAPPGTAEDTVRRIVWPHGQAELQRLGGRLAPVQIEAGRPSVMRCCLHAQALDPKEPA